MIVSIIRSDNVVVVDGRGLNVDCSSLPGHITAVQWVETVGHIEYDNKPNLDIKSIGPFQALLNAWEVAREAADSIKPPTPEPGRVAVLKSVVLSRLTDKQLDAALEVMTNRQKERWRSPDVTTVYADDPEVIGLIQFIGADPDVVLASFGGTKPKV